jgi:hypothetical protein
MDFYAVVAQVIELLRSRARVSYRALKLQLQIDDETIEALKDELIYAQRVAVDEESRVLVWTGGVGATPAPAPTPSASGPSDIPRDLPVEVVPRPVDTRPPEAERRQLTVRLCCKNYRNKREAPRIDTLCCQLEQPINDPVLCDNIPLGGSLELAFAKHVYGFIALDCPLRRGEGSKAQPRIHTAFDKPVILFYHVIKVLALSELTDFWKYSIVLKDVEGRWVGGVLVHSDDARKHRMACVQYLPEELFSSVSITAGAQHEV